jgi:hypothetical protein
MHTWRGTSLAQVLALIEAGSFMQAMNVGSLFLALRSRGLIRAEI